MLYDNPEHPPPCTPRRSPPSSGLTASFASASSTFLPLIHSVANDDEAIADPQPKVLNFASSMTCVSGLTLICKRITSPHSGAPTRPVPTSALLLSSVPTLRGLL